MRAASSSNGAGIGGYGSNAACGTVNIYGGIVTATGTGGGAGIGSGVTKNANNNNTDSKIVIMGKANVTAQGIGGGAGIGSGHGLNSAGGASDITIGGNVDVTANGSGSGFQGGAGIGGGTCSRGGKITISGGTVKATGANGGAGIGSGYSGKTATTITIEGGAVTATGSRYGNNSYYSAAIGHGYSDQTVGSIYLNGGSITTESYGIGYFKPNINYPWITINLQDHADAIINAGNYYGRVTIECPLLNPKTGEKVTADNMPTGPSELILGDTTRYEITSFSDEFGNSVTPWSNGIAYNNPLAGDKIDIVVTPGAGYRYKANSLTVKDADGNPVKVVNQRFEMPAKNVTLSAIFEKIPITYIAPDGTTKSNVTDYTPITSELTEWAGASTPKVYAVFGEVKISKRVTISDNVTLVLTDGAALTPFYGITVLNGQTLNICGNSTEADVMGTLTIAYTVTECAGIGGTTGNQCGVINICGGKISAQGNNGAGIGGGKTINTVKTINISGGTVTATGSKNGAGIGGGNGTEGGTINISGGKIEATGGENAAGIGNGYGNTGASNLTVDFSGDDDSLKASSYTALTVENGKILVDSEGAASYTGTLNAEQLAAIKDKTLVKAYSISVNVTGEGCTVTPSAGAAPKSRRVTLDVSPAEGYVLQTLTYQVEGSSESVNIAKGDDGKYAFEMPQGNVTVTAAFALHEHSFTFSANDATVTAACNDTNCALHGSPATLTLSAADATYTGSAYTGASLSDTTAWTGAGLTAPTIEYYHNQKCNA